MNESNAHIQSKTIKFKFDCRENLESMLDTEKGKFCSSCKQEVMDFTQMSYTEIQNFRGDRSSMCGTFLMEQIQPDLRPIETPKVRSLAFLSTILLSLNFSSVSAQSTVDPKIEQSQGASNAPRLSPAEAKEKAKGGQHISMSKATPTDPQNSNEKESKIEYKPRDSKKWFWSKRFPFIHRRRRFVSGRFL